MTLSRAVLGQIDWWWNAIFRPRLAGLTDDEYLWEPVADCWTLHDIGAGLSTFDFNWPPPKVPPVTTIAWRMAHVGIGCLAVRTSEYFPAVVAEPWPVERHQQPVPFPVTAAGAVAFLEHWFGLWRRGVESLGDEGLWKPIGLREQAPDMQLGPDDPMIGLVFHQHRELMHHGAEVNLLRDLYAAQQPQALVLRAAELAWTAWSSLSASASTSTPSTRACRRCITPRRDPTWNMIAAGWARHFTHEELARLLDHAGYEASSRSGKSGR